MKASFQRCLLYTKKVEIDISTHFLLSLGFPSSPRRERDSNPRSLSAQRFSRPPQSTTLPSLLVRMRLSHERRLPASLGDRDSSSQLLVFRNYKILNSQKRVQKYCFFLNCANIFEVFLRMWKFYSNFAAKNLYSRTKCYYKY